MSQPPTVGPTDGPTIAPSAKTACDAPSRWRGNVSRKAACAVATRPPPKSPWTTRHRISCWIEPERPQSTEAMREADDRDRVVLAPPEARLQPGRQRDDDDRRDDVARDDPGAFLLGGAEVALDRGKRDVDDRGVERLHQRRGHDPQGDQDQPRAVLADVAVGGQLCCHKSVRRWSHGGLDSARTEVGFGTCIGGRPCGGPSGQCERDRGAGNGGEQVDDVVRGAGDASDEPGRRAADVRVGLAGSAAAIAAAQLLNRGA